MATQAWADYMPFNGAAVARNIAEIRIRENGVYVQLEILPEDIGVFEALVPDGWVSDAPKSRPPAVKRLIEFAENGLSIQTDAGRILPVELALIEPRLRIDRASPFAGVRDPISGRIFPEPPEDKRVIYAELFYSFADARPDAITIFPPSDETGNPLLPIGIVVFDRSVPVTKFSFLSTNARAEINWDDPWYTLFDNPNLRRHHQSAITTFLYVEPREIRHETLIRLRDLEDWINLGLEGETEIDARAQERIKTAARTFLSERNPVEIDGVPIVPASSRASFLTVSDVGMTIVDKEGDLDPNSTFVGVILSFPIPALPQTAVVNWDMFNDRIQNVPATITDPISPFLSGAKPHSPLIEWKNFLRNYEEPRVDPVVLPSFGYVTISLLTLVLVVVTIGVFALAIRRQGVGRITLLLLGLCILATAFPARKVARLEFASPFASTPDVTDSAEIFTSILEGIAAVNLETDPLIREEKLKVIVGTKALDSVLAEINRALEIEVAGGGFAKIDAVEDVVANDISKLSETQGFQTLFEWKVRASAAHWGHNHRRKLKYRAHVEIVREKGSWKLVGFTVVNIRDVG